MTNKVRKDLVRELRRQGFDVTVTGGGHLRVRGPQGGLVFMASTPGDYRSIRNALAQLRRIGFHTGGNA